MTAKVPDPRVLQSRAGELRAEATRQRTLMAERLESEWDDASFVKVTELKSGIAQEEQFTTLNRQRADEKATRAAELREEQARLSKSGDARGAEEVGEAAAVGEHQVATLRRMAVEADQRLAAKRVELAELDQARVGNPRPSDDEFRAAEQQFDLMEDQARDLELAARRAQAAEAIENVAEKATAELEAEQAFGRARSATFDPAKITTITGSDVNVTPELPPIDTSWPDTETAADLSLPFAADADLMMTPPATPLTPDVGLLGEGRSGENANDPADDAVGDGGGVAPERVDPDPGSPSTLDGVGGGVITPTIEPSNPGIDLTGDAPGDQPLDGFDDGGVDAPLIDVRSLGESMPEPDFAPSEPQDEAGSFAVDGGDVGRTDDGGIDGGGDFADDVGF